MNREQMIEIGGVTVGVLALLYYYMYVYTPPVTDTGMVLDNSTVENATPVAASNEIDWSIFNPSAGSDAGTAMTDYTSLLTGMTTTLSDLVKSSADAGNSNLFPLFGYAATTGDTALRYQSHDTTSGINMTALPYQASTLKGYEPPEPIRQEMGVVMNSFTGEVYQVPANSIKNMQAALDAKSVGDAVNYNNRLGQSQSRTSGVF